METGVSSCTETDIAVSETVSSIVVCNAVSSIVICDISDTIELSPSLTDGSGDASREAVAGGVDASFVGKSEVKAPFMGMGDSEPLIRGEDRISDVEEGAGDGVPLIEGSGDPPRLEGAGDDSESSTGC